MSEERMGTIEEEGKDAGKTGGGSFYYVDKDSAERDGIDMFKAEQGANFITVLPPADDKQFYAREVFIHRDIGPRNLTFLCMRHTRTAKTSKQEAVEWGKPCAVCEKFDRVTAKNPDSELLKDLRPSRRFLFLFKDTSTLPADATMEEMEDAKLPTKWYDGSPRFRDCITGVSKEKRTGKYNVDVSDPDKGKTVCFDRVGQKKKTRYDGFQLEDRAPIPDSWLDTPDYDKLLLIPEYDVVKTNVEGMLAKPAEGEGRTRGRNRGGGSDTTAEGDTTGGRTRTRQPRDEVETEPPAEEPVKESEQPEPEREAPAETQEPVAEQEKTAEEKPARTRARTEKPVEKTAEKETASATSENAKIAAVREKIAARKRGEGSA